MIPQSNYHPFPVYGRGQVSALGVTSDQMVSVGTGAGIGALAGYLVGRLLDVPVQGAVFTGLAGAFGVPMLGLVATAIYSGSKS